MTNKTKKWMPFYGRKQATLEYKIQRYGLIEGTERHIKFIDKHKKSSKRCIDYWLKEGYSEEKAKEKLKEHQNTFSKKKCIERYGEKEGIDVFNKRQDKWQATLNSKSEEEISNINRKKSSRLFDNFNKPCIFYVLEIKQNLYKIGITTKGDVKHRYHRDILDSVKIISQTKSNLYNCSLIEQIIKCEMISNNNSILPEEVIKPFGWTETFKIDKESMLSIIEYYLSISTTILERKFICLPNCCEYYSEILKSHHLI